MYFHRVANVFRETFRPNVCHGASRYLGLILRFCQILSALPRSTIKFPQENFYIS